MNNHDYPLITIQEWWYFHGTPKRSKLVELTPSNYGSLPSVTPSFWSYVHQLSYLAGPGIVVHSFRYPAKQPTLVTYVYIYIYIRVAICIYIYILVYIWNIPHTNNVNNILLANIEGPVWYTTYHHLPALGVYPPLFFQPSDIYGWCSLKSNGPMFGIPNSLDWFKGKNTGKSHDLHWKIHGFL